MECSYLTVDFFRKLPQDVEKGGNPTQSIFDRYNDSYLRRIGRFITQKRSFLKDRDICCLKFQCMILKLNVFYCWSWASLTMHEQGQPFCHMLIWFVLLCGTPFQSPLFIVKSVKLKEACWTFSTLNWVNWRWEQFSPLPSSHYLFCWNRWFVWLTGRKILVAKTIISIVEWGSSNHGAT